MLRERLLLAHEAITFIILFGACCAQEVGNARDRYAILVLRGSNVVGPLSQKISRISSLRWHDHLYNEWTSLFFCLLISRVHGGPLHFSVSW